MGGPDSVSYPGILLRRQNTNSCHGVHCSDSLLAPGSVQGLWEQRVCPSSWALAFGMEVPQYPLTNRSRRGKSQLSDSLKAVEPDTSRAGDKGYLCLAGGFFCLSTFVLVQVEDQPEI